MRKSNLLTGFALLMALLIPIVTCGGVHKAGEHQGLDGGQSTGHRGDVNKRDQTNGGTPKIPTASTAGNRSGEMKTIAKSGNAFAVDLYGRLSENKGNLFFSPTSIHTALGMTYAGARNRTAAQMAKTLHIEKAGWDINAGYSALIRQLNTPRMVRTYEWIGNQRKQTDNPAYQLVIANALWGQKGDPWEKDFLDLIAAIYGAGLHEVDFVKYRDGAAKTINAWIEKETRERIKDLIPPGGLGAMTRLVLTNAIYFKAHWDREFPKQMTAGAPFNVSAMQKIVTPMMHMKRNFKYMETDTFQVLEMPYKAHALAMAVFLPKKIDGLGRLEKSLTPARISGWLEMLTFQEVVVTFPKFEFSSRFGLSQILAAMGMKDAFSPSEADFSGMTSAEKVFVSDVLHKAFVAVDEKGTEAAAATAVIAAGAAFPKDKPEPKIFTADHPFLFIICHKNSGAILFMGRVANPKKKG